MKGSNENRNLQIIKWAGVSVLCFVAGGFLTFLLFSSEKKEVESYINTINTIQGEIVQKAPIYADFITADKESELRKHLLQDHIDVAKRFQLSPIQDFEHLKEAVTDQKLVEVKLNRDSGFYFYNVKKELRFLHPSALKVLHLISSRFQKNLKEYLPKTIPADYKVKAKIAITSALRTVEYQKGLRKKNRNAALESSHSYGVSFDIFFDDYFLQVNQMNGQSEPSGLFKTLRANIKKRAGFWLGDSLRRQMRSLLTKTLLQLQREGALYAILEKRQKCYHVTPRHE